MTRPVMDSPTISPAICPRCRGALDSLLHGKHCCACRTLDRAGVVITVYCWTHAPEVLKENERIECTCGKALLRSTRFYACRECRAEDYDATLGGMGR